MVLTLRNKLVPMLFVAITNQRCISWFWTFIHRDCGSWCHGARGRGTVGVVAAGSARVGVPGQRDRATRSRCPGRGHSSWAL